MWEIVLPALRFDILRVMSFQELLAFRSVRSYKVFVMHGSWKNIKAAWTKVQSFSSVVASLNLGDSPVLSQLPSTACWLLMQHLQCDGVTSGNWWCGTSLSHSPRSYPMNTGRRLKHILSSMHSGRPVSREVDFKFIASRPLWTSNGFDANGLLPVDKLSALFVCPSIYGKLVSRELADEELRNAWDIGLDQASDVLTEVIVSSIPAKVLLSFGQGLVNHFSTSADSKFGNNLSVQLVSDNGEGSVARRISYTNSLEDDLNLFPAPETRQRAAKNDDADIPADNWDGPFWSFLVKLGRPASFLQQARTRSLGNKEQPILTVFRGWLLRLWRVTVRRSFLRYFHSDEVRERESDLEAARDCIRRVCNASFWDWAGGSRLLFWRWPLPLRAWARDGLPVFYAGELPCYRTRQPPAPDEHTKAEVAAKLSKFVSRGYISPGPVISLISFFGVPKGDSDIRLVFDGTKSGLNSKLWAPSFCLPTVESLLPMLEPGTWQSDIDVGEQFYNYMLDPSIQPFCGIDLNPYFGSGNQQQHLSWMRWN